MLGHKLYFAYFDEVSGVISNYNEEKIIFRICHICDPFVLKNHAEYSYCEMLEINTCMG